MKDGPSAMIQAPFRTAGTVCVMLLLLLASGCHRHRKSKSAPNTDAYSDNLHQMVEKKALPPEKLLRPFVFALLLNTALERKFICITVLVSDVSWNSGVVNPAEARMPWNL